MSSFSTMVADQQIECCICFEEIGSKNNCVTPCGHSFCFNCVTQALSRKNTCPICRTVLIETAEEEEDEDSDYEEDDEEDDDEDDEEEEIPGDDGGIDEITDRFLKSGYTTIDIMSMLTGRYKRSDPKNTQVYIKKMIKEFEDMIDDVDAELYERNQMGEEDIQA